MEDIKVKELPQLVLCIIICEAAGVIGSVFTNMSVYTWYPTLVKPWFTPPGWVIGIVWIILFILMGIALFFVWRSDMRLRDSHIRNAIVVFGEQLIINILWSAAFFGLQSPLLGLAVIFVLWVLILATIVMFWQVSRDAALLLVPYILWVSFAGFLNYNLWLLNH